MVNPAPKIDSRTATEIAKQVKDLLAIYAPTWQEFDPATSKPNGVSAALIGIFARFAELIIQRLNQVPEKNFLAFLDLLGASLLPPQPARVPLTFSLAAGSAVDAVVPAGTQVAAPPAEGEKEPVIFETERELVVTAAQLASVFMRDPERDMYADLSAIIAASASPGVLVFQGNQKIEHIFYLGHSQLLGFPKIKNLRLTLELEQGLGDGGKVEWQLWNGAEWEAKGPVIITTKNLPETKNTDMDFGFLCSIDSKFQAGLDDETISTDLKTVSSSNKIKLSDNATVSVEERGSRWLIADQNKQYLIRKNGDQLDVYNLKIICDFDGITPIPICTVDSQDNRWLRCLLRTPITPAAGQQSGMVRASELPVIKAITMEVELDRQNLLIDLAFANIVPVDLSKDFFPFGEKPKLGDTFYLANGEAFSKVGARITLNVTLSQLGDASDNLNLKWEFGNGKTWIELGTTAPGQKTTGASASFQDTTQAFTQEGTVIFDVPQAPLLTTVNGIETYWVRVRIISGNYGEEARYELVTMPQFLFRTDFSVADYTAYLDNGEVPDGLKEDFMEKAGIVLSPDVAVMTKETGNRWLIISGNTIYLAKLEENGLNIYLQTTGYQLIPATFAPPAISSIKVDYSLTSDKEPPEAVLAYNDFVYNDFTTATPFVPFQATEDTKSTLYHGFTLPPDRKAFPNRPISLFSRVADFKYGERFALISPIHSKKFGIPDSVTKVEVIHKFFITNAEPVKKSFELKFFGTRMDVTWETTVKPSTVTDLAPGESQEVTVTVKIPAGTKPGNSDRGFLLLSRTDDPTLEYIATFVTIADKEIPSGEQLQLIWEYWNGTTWTKLTVRDDAENFTRPDLIEFLAPSDFARHSEFGLDRYWLRVRWESGEYVIAPRLNRMLLNTTMAAQTVTIRNEILGSSDASENQQFRTTRKPVLSDQQIEVREAEMPSAEEQKVIANEEGDDAISTILDATGRPKEIWVRWHEVPDFYGSGPRDRHYVPDHLAGQIRFGNGLNGLIPPRGTGNIRVARYQTGGSTAGNKPAGTIVQLKTTVPYVEKVTNTEAASGGANAEPLASLLDRAPRTIRHCGRSVTLEDYEDLALLASPEVARAKCVPLRNLTQDPFGQNTAPGEVSVIIVPRSKDAKPLPSLELINRVQDYLKTSGIPTANISVVGPLYVCVEVTAEIALTSPEGVSAVEQLVHQTLAAFLHPLTGGLDGAGWAFGRAPHKSDLCALIEAVSGVDHIRSLIVDEIEDESGAIATGRFLVYSGIHTITLVFETN